MAHAADNPFNAPTLSQLQGRTSVKWRTYDAPVLPLWVAEMDVVPDPVIHQVVSQAMVAGDTGYPPPFHTFPPTQLANASVSDRDYRELPSYGAAISDFAAQRWGWNFDPVHARPVSDVMHGIYHLVRGLAPGGVVAINNPAYPPFTTYAQYAGATVITAGMTTAGRLDFEELERVFAQADIFLLCNPHNPGGVVHTPQELQHLLELATKFQVTVISDEVHGTLTSMAVQQEMGRDPFTPLLSVQGSERSFTVTSAAKGWNLAGFKAAVVISGADAAEELERVFSHAFESASHIAVIAHTAAVMWARPWLDRVRTAIDLNRVHLASLLAEQLPQAKVLPGQATYLAWVDLSAVTTASGKPLGPNPAQFFLEQAKVAVNSGLSFGSAGANHVRINFATSQANLDLALDRITEALTKN